MVNIPVKIHLQLFIGTSWIALIYMMKVGFKLSDIAAVQQACPPEKGMQSESYCMLFSA